MKIKITLSFFFIVLTCTVCTAQDRWNTAWNGYHQHNEQDEVDPDSIHYYVKELVLLGRSDYGNNSKEHLWGKNLLGQWYFNFAGKKDSAHVLWMEVHQHLKDSTNSRFNNLKQDLYWNFVWRWLADNRSKASDVEYFSGKYLEYTKKTDSLSVYHNSLVAVFTEFRDSALIQFRAGLYREALQLLAWHYGENWASLSHAIASAYQQNVKNPNEDYLRAILSIHYTEEKPAHFDSLSRKFASNFFDGDVRENLRNSYKYGALALQWWLSEKGRNSAEVTGALIRLIRLSGENKFAVRTLQDEIKRLEVSGTGRSEQMIELLQCIHMMLPETAYEDKIGILEKLSSHYLRLMGNKHPDYLNTRVSLAKNLLEMEQAERALEVMTDVLELSKPSLGLSDSYLGYKMTYGSCFVKIGRYAEAGRIYSEVYYDYRKLIGENAIDKRLLIIVEEIVSIYENNEDKAKEIYWLEVQRQLLLHLGDSRSDFYNYNCYKLFIYYTDLEVWSSARYYLSELEKSVQVNTNNLGAKVNLLSGKIFLYKKLNQFDSCSATLPEFVKLSEFIYHSTRKNTDRKNVIVAYETAFLFYCDSDLPDSAYQYLMKYIALEQSVGNKEKPHLLSGKYYQTKGALDSAIYHFEKLRTPALLHTDHEIAEYISVMGLLAGAYWQSGNKIKAEEDLRRVVRTLTKFSIKNMAGFSEREKQVHIKSFSETVSKYQNLVGEFPSYDSVITNGFNFLQQTKALLLNSEAFIKERATSGDSALNATYSRLLLVKKGLTKAIQSRASQAVIDSLEELERELQRKLSQGSTVYDDYLRSSSITFEDIRRGLQTNEAVIDFVSFPYYNGKKFTDSTLHGAFIVKSQAAAPLYVPLPAEEDIAKYIQMQQVMFTRGQQSANSSRRNVKDSSFARLYELIWSPIETYLQGVQKVYLIPDGLFHKVSFAALRDSRGGYLSDMYQLHTNLTARDAVEKSGEKKPASVLLFGGSVFEIERKNATHAGERSIPEDLAGKMKWKDLAGTRIEVEKIAELAKKNGLSASVRTGLSASEEEFKKAASSSAPSIIHVATHGYYFPRSKLNITDASYKRSDEPLLRSGIVFSGANYAWMGNMVHDDEEDGILTAMELSNLDLSKTELAILSACETGVGEIVQGEGVYGLQRALKQAGVKKMLVSLWPVPDKETAEMMEYFYAHLFEGKSISVSFREAQARMRELYPDDPGLWAAFTLIE